MSLKMATRSGRQESRRQENRQPGQQEGHSQNESYWARVKEHTTKENLFQMGGMALSAFSIPNAVRTYGDYDMLFDVIARSTNLESVLSYLKSCGKSGLFDRCRTILSKSSECITQADKEVLLKEITNSKGDILRKFLVNELITFVTVILAQGATLYNVWNELSEAKNVIVESADLRKTIQNDLDKLKLKSENLKEDMQKFAEQQAIQIGDWTRVGEGYTPEVTSESFAKFNNNRELQGMKIRDFHSQIMELDGLCKGIRSKMDLNIKIKINNKITRLQFDHVNCIKDGVIDGVYLAKGAFELIQGWSSPMGWMKGIKVASTVAFSGLLAANTYTAFVTDARVKELQSEWDKLAKLEMVLDDVQSNIKLMDEWRKQMDNHSRSCLNKIK